MKPLTIAFAPRAMRPPIAAQYLGLSEDLLLRCVQAKWLKPRLATRNLTLYETADLHDLWERIKREGLPK